MYNPLVFTLPLIVSFSVLANGAPKSESPLLMRQCAISIGPIEHYDRAAKAAKESVNILELGMSETYAGSGVIKANRVATVPRLRKTYEVVSGEREKGLWVSETSHLGYNRLLCSSRTLFELRYDVKLDRLFASGEDSISILDPNDDTETKRIVLKARPSRFEIGNESRTLFVGIADSPIVLTIDIASGEIVGETVMKTGFRVGAMAFDEARGQLLVADGDAGGIVVVDTRTNKVSATVNTEARVGSLFCDSTHNRALAICGAGTIDTLCRNENSWKRCGSLPTLPGASVAQYSPEGGTLYLVVPAAQGSRVWVYDTASTDR